MKRILYILLLLPTLANAQPYLHIIASADTICAGTLVNFNSTISGSMTSPHYRWEVNRVRVGTDYFIYNSDSLNSGDTVLCQLTNNAGDTIINTSNLIIMTVLHLPPTAGVILGPDTTVCIGTILIFSDSVAGGKWSDEYGVVTIDSGVTTVKSSDDGEGASLTDSIYYTLSNSCGSVAASKAIGIIPTPEAGFDLGYPQYPPLCVGQWYELNGGDGASPGDNIYSINGYAIYEADDIFCLKAGNDILISINTNACGSDTFRQNITIIAIPDTGTIIARSKSLCVGDTMNLLATGIEGYAEWASSNSNANIDNSGLLTGISPGLVAIALTVYNSCGSVYSYVLFAVDSMPPPIYGLDSVYKGYSISLSDSLPGGGWSSNNPNIAAIDPSTGMLSGISDGVATISYTLQNGCYDTSTVTVKTCEHEVVFYPSPARDQLVLHEYVDVFNTCSIINVAGQKVLQQPVTFPFTYVNIASLPTGMYFISIDGDSKNFVGRFVKE